MSREDGGPAFPRPHSPNPYSGTDDGPEPGMSLRDWFAATASDDDLRYWRGRAEAEVGLGGNVREAARYLHADAMLKERAR